VAAHFFNERGPVQGEHPRRFGNDPVGGIERTANPVTLKRRHFRAQVNRCVVIDGGARACGRAAWRMAVDQRSDRAVIDRATGMQHGRPLDQIAEFAHIARPAISGKHADCGRTERDTRQTRRLRLKMRDQIADVLNMVGERGHRHCHHRQPIVKIRAKPPCPHRH